VEKRLGFTGGLATTAMGIMPHENVDRALDLALSMDIPFWPQLPKLSYHEDMYVQAMEHFPGVVINETSQRIYVDTEKFMDGIPAYLEDEADPELFTLSPQFSLIYRKFLNLDLSGYRSVRGQLISPVSLSLKIGDENGKPIAYNDEMRSLAFSFIQKKVNLQAEELRQTNERAFVWVDDPGLEFIFNALCGYDNVKAKSELTVFFEGIEGPRGIHLCGRPDWDFLFSLPVEIVSFNAFAFGETVATYDTVRRFLENGNIISWGIVPTYHDEFSKEDITSLANRLASIWNLLEAKGIDRSVIARNSVLAPATCNLLNVDRTVTVDNAFMLLKELSIHLKERYL
jgi:hypothetical protein